MKTVRSYRDLEVWQAAMDLVESCYLETARFPEREQYGLTSQVRRAAVSIASNIAEGDSRRTRGAYLHHLVIALESNAELETQSELALRLSFLDGQAAARIATLTTRTGQMLSALVRTLRHSQRAESRGPNPVGDGILPVSP